MSDVSKLNFGDNGGNRNIKDAVAREKLTVVDPSAGQGMIQFGVDAQGNYGYKKVGADTVIPFKSGESIEGNLEVWTRVPNTLTNVVARDVYLQKVSSISSYGTNYEEGFYMIVYITEDTLGAISKITPAKFNETLKLQDYYRIGSNLYLYLYTFYVSEANAGVASIKITPKYGTYYTGFNRIYKMS